MVNLRFCCKMKRSFLEKSIFDFVIPVSKEVSKDMDRKFYNLNKSLESGADKYLEKEARRYVREYELAQTTVLC